MNKKYWLNPCKCGTKKKVHVQDFGAFAFVKCVSCGNDTGRLASADAAAAEWSKLNPPGVTSENPSSVTVSGQKLMDWFMKSAKGECVIHAMEGTDENGKFRLVLSWPEPNPQADC